MKSKSFVDAESKVQLTPKPTQFDSGLALRTAATPTCSSCCCCCCCVATIVSAPILNGAAGASFASRHKMPVGRAKWVATLAPILAMLVAVVSLTAFGSFESATGNASGWLWLPVGLVIAAGLVASFAWAARSAGTSRYGLFWMLGFLSIFGVAFMAEVAIGVALIFGAGPAYLLVPALIIPAVVVWRRSILKGLDPKEEATEEPVKGTPLGGGEIEWKR